eukprot:scaffold15425_cov141-Skeletonema_dohrnii-CCMP3373.AAC.3
MHHDTDVAIIGIHKYLDTIHYAFISSSLISALEACGFLTRASASASDDDMKPAAVPFRQDV